MLDGTIRWNPDEEDYSALRDQLMEFNADDEAE